MRIRVISSLFVSLMIIGLALWFRFSPNENSAVELIAVAMENSVSGASLQDTPEGYLPNTQANEKLSNTDIVSRQLFADYADLKSRGETSSENLGYLAERYADGILNIEPGASKTANVGQLSIIPDSAENIFNYGKSMIAARSKYAASAKEESENAGNLAQDGFNDFISRAGDLYLASANELLKIKVPVSLARNHLEIINNYFQSAEAMRTIAESADDPIKIYAAIQTQVQNAKRENDLFLNIQIAMSTNGIIWSGNLNQ